MLGSIKYNLSHLFDGSGRDARQTFWFYVLFLVIIQMVVSFAVSIPMMAGAMGDAFSSAQKGADQAAMQAEMMSRMSGMMGTMAWFGLATSIATVILLAASFVRRLHDSGKPGFWAAIVGALYLGAAILNIIMLPQMMEVMQASAQAGTPQAVMEAQGSMTAISLIGWIPLIMLVVFGVMKSDPGPNQYGEEPVRF